MKLYFKYRNDLIEYESAFDAEIMWCTLSNTGLSKIANRQPTLLKQLAVCVDHMYLFIYLTKSDKIAIAILYIYRVVFINLLSNSKNLLHVYEVSEARAFDNHRHRRRHQRKRSTTSSLAIVATPAELHTTDSVHHDHRHCCCSCRCASHVRPASRLCCNQTAIHPLTRSDHDADRSRCRSRRWTRRSRTSSRS